MFVSSYEFCPGRHQRRQQAAAGQCFLQVISCSNRLPTLLKCIPQEHLEADGAARVCISVKQNILQQEEVRLA